MTQLTKLKFNLFSFQGRISRADYLSGLIIVLLMSLICIYVPNQIILKNSKLVFHHFISNIFITLNFMISIVSLWIILALHVKRLHDLNRSGWWSLLLFTPLTPIIVLICLFIESF